MFSFRIRDVIKIAARNKHNIYSPGMPDTNKEMKITKDWLLYNMVRETAKKVSQLVARPLRGGRGVKNFLKLSTRGGGVRP